MPLSFANAIKSGKARTLEITLMSRDPLNPEFTGTAPRREDDLRDTRIEHTPSRAAQWQGFA